MSLPELSSEEHLLHLMAEGDEYSFLLLFRHYQRHVFRIAYRFVKSHAIAEELVQEIFLKVWQSRHKLPEVREFRDWLFIVSRNQILNHLREAAKDQQLEHVWADEQALHVNSTDHRLREKSFADLLRGIIQSLPEQQQAVFRLAREEHLTYKEIGERLGISAGTVRIHMSRALQFIRTALSARGITYTMTVLLNYF